MASGADHGIDDIGELTVVGAGGFSTVYAGWDGGFQRQVAVKILHSLDEDGRRRFDRERGLMGRLSDHPNVITPFRSGFTIDGSPYVVMEYLPAGSLDDLVRRGGPLSWEQAVTYLRPIADALGYGHDHGVIHRDVKPANILVDHRDQSKLTDFGISAIRESTATLVAFTLAHAPRRPSATASTAGTSGPTCTRSCPPCGPWSMDGRRTRPTAPTPRRR